MRGARVGVSVLCPGWVKTQVMDSMRNRPPALQDDPAAVTVSSEMMAAMEAYRQACEGGMSPDKVADCVFQAISENQFYILTHPEFTPMVEARMAAIVQGSNPMDLRAMEEASAEPE
jgi:short-subunit dehydrogenase